MKKMLYIVRYPLNKVYSIKQKLDGQIDAWSKLDYNVSYLCYDSKCIYLSKNKELIQIKKKRRTDTNSYFHIFSYFDLYRLSKKIIKNEKYDFIYIRSAPVNLAALKMIKKASYSTKIVVEIPSFSIKGKEKPKNFLRLLYGYYSNIIWNRISKYVDLFVLIGEQAKTFLGRPAININNGVNVDNIPIKKNEYDGKIHILAVASMSEWHGYDRLINGFFRWNSNEKAKYIIDLVGDEGDGSIDKWKNLVNSLNLSNQVIFHGKKVGNELNNLYDYATIGVSSLGFFRIGFHTGSVLKLREYMARGLPFIYAHDDPDLYGDYEWCLHVPNDSSFLDMNIVDSFIQKVLIDDSIKYRMREYAIQNMSWEKQFEKVIDFLNLD